MTILASEIKKIHEEDVSANGTVSEGFFKKIAATLNGVVDNFLWDVGDLRASALSEALFASRNGYDINLPEEQKRWVLMRGQPIEGSKLHALTGLAALRDMVSNGAHLEQKEANGAMLEYFWSQNKAHTHAEPVHGGNAGASIAGFIKNVTLNGTSETGVSGNSKARPNSVAVNFFIKIND